MAEERSAESLAAEEQNKKAQEEARAQIEADNAKRLEAQRAAVGDTSTKPMDFETAAAETEALEQPPNPFNARELEQNAGKGQPPAKNVNAETMPEDLKAENMPTSEAVAPSPTTQRRTRSSK